MLNTGVNVAGAVNKAYRVLFYLKRFIAALTSSIYIFIRPHLEYAIQTFPPYVKTRQVPRKAALR